MSVTYEYPRPALTVDALVLTGKHGERRILLIRRAREPFKNLWALPGGFVDMEETLCHAVCRELEEETGISLKEMEQFRVFDAIGRDPRHRTISVVFYKWLPDPFPVKGGDDASEAAWFSLTELPSLAFDHGEIIGEFLKRIMDKEKVNDW